MPYKTGSLKGQLLTSEIRKLVRLHNKLSKITIPPRSSRDDIIKIIEDNGYKIDHQNQKLTATRMNKDLTLKEAQETFPVKQRVKKETPKVESPKPKKEDEVRPAKKAFPPIPKNIRGKRVNVKFEKPATKERIETGALNVGKLEEPKLKIKIKIKKEKKVRKPTGEKVKKAVEKIEKKEEPEPKKKEPEPKKEEQKNENLKKVERFYNQTYKGEKTFSEAFDSDKLVKMIEDLGVKNLITGEIKRIYEQRKDKECNLKKDDVDKLIDEVIFSNEKFSNLSSFAFFTFKPDKNDTSFKDTEVYKQLLRMYKKRDELKCSKSDIANMEKAIEYLNLPTVQKFNKRTPLKKGEEPEPTKAEPKKKKVNFDKIEEGLEDMDDETGAMALEIRTSKKYNMKKPNFTEKEIFEDTKYKNMKDLESKFEILKNMSDDLTDEDEKQIALNLIENIRDRLPFILDNIK